MAEITSEHDLHIIITLVNSFPNAYYHNTTYDHDPSRKHILS